MSEHSENSVEKEASFDEPQSPDNEQDNAPQSPTGELRELYNRDDDEAAPASPTMENSTPASPEAQNSGPASPKSPDSPVRRNVVNSDDEEEDEPSTSRKRVFMDSDDDEPPAQKRLIGSDMSDDEDNAVKTKSQNLFGDDDDSDDEDNAVKTKSVNLFGDDDDSDDEEVAKNPENEGDDEFAEKDDEESGNNANKDDSDDDDGDFSKKRMRDGEGFEWDFDILTRQKKAERKKKTRRNGKDGGIDIINDDDGLVSHLVEKMKAAAKADRNANVEKKPAFQKIKLLTEVKDMMNRAGIVEALVENGFMSAVSEWLAPLPDKCLPALDIRITMLKLLHNPRFWKLDRSTLKHSGLGKAVMLLYKHPNETKANKMIANKLIAEWARPIFQLDTDYSSMTKEERVDRDYERMPEVKKKKLNIHRHEENFDEEKKKPQIRETSGITHTKSGELKIGDKGYINRARVPKPSTRDYVVRPKWNVEGECKDRKATGTRRYDQAFRDFQERTKKSKASRSVKVSLEGRNLEI